MKRLIYWLVRVFSISTFEIVVNNKEFIMNVSHFFTNQGSNSFVV